VLLLDHLPAGRAEVAFDVQPILLADFVSQFRRDQVQGLFVHGAAYAVQNEIFRAK